MCGGALLGFVMIQASQTFASDVKEMDLPEVHIDAAGGQFVLSKLHLKRGGVSAPTKLTGVMTNATGRNWNTIRLNVEPNLALKFNSPVRKYDLKPGEAFPFYWQLPGKRELEDLKFTFTVDGTFSPKYVFKLVRPVESNDLRFQDATVEVILLPFSEGVGFHITNRSESVLKFVWNEAAIVDWSGKTLKVMGKGVRYITRNEPRPAASIPPGARLEDQLVPIDNVTYEGGSLGWGTKPLYPDCPECQDLQGREFAVYLPLVLGDKSMDYTLAVKIVSVE